MYTDVLFKKFSHCSDTSVLKLDFRNILEDKQEVSNNLYFIDIKSVFKYPTLISIDTFNY